jgi:hypothetical protein
VQAPPEEDYEAAGAEEEQEAGAEEEGEGGAGRGEAAGGDGLPGGGAGGGGHGAASLRAAWVLRVSVPELWAAPSEGADGVGRGGIVRVDRRFRLGQESRCGG